MHARLTRSQLFSSGARSGAVLALAGSGLGALAGSAEAAPPNDAIGALSGDLAYVRLLDGVELLMVDFWTDAIGSRHLSGKALRERNLALANESEHYTYLAGVLTEVRPGPVDGGRHRLHLPDRGVLHARA